MASQETRSWRAAWGAALQVSPAPQALPAGTALARQVSASIGGDAIRVELSNRYGPVPLTVSAKLITESGARDFTFGDLGQITIPTGAIVYSDLLSIPVQPGERLAIEVALPVGGTIHDIERTANGEGATLRLPDGSASPALAGILATLDVLAAPGPTFAVLGDTKSARPDSWVDRVAELADGRLSMVNRSVYGGKLALGDDPANGLARFDHDIIATSGITAAIIFCGNNDLIQPGMVGSRGTPILDPALMQSEAQLQALLRQAAQRARSAGLLAIGATWTPYEDVTIAEGYSTPEKMALRASINDWMRKDGIFDSVIDFDAALRDSGHHDRLDPRYDAGNHFTPNEAGIELMAQTALNSLLEMSRLTV